MIKIFKAILDFLTGLGERGSLCLVNQGETIGLAALVAKTAGQNLKLCLYKSNTTPAAAHIESDYTKADFTGYADITLVAANWTITAGAPSHADYAQQTFTSTAGSQNQAVYGYILLQETSGKLVWAEKFSDGPYTIVNNGDNIKVTPVITLAGSPD